MQMGDETFNRHRRWAHSETSGSSIAITKGTEWPQYQTSFLGSGFEVWLTREFTEKRDYLIYLYFDI